jgi:HK97 family phage prohead protease
MLTAAPLGGLEVRADSDGSVRVTGRFPFGVEAELAPGRTEVFSPGALEPAGNVLLLSQHRFETPLASTDTGTLELRSEPDGLAFEARLSPDVAGTSHGRDALALIRSGLAVGLSPGFRVQAGGERIERRGSGVLRTITRAVLHEISVVTRPAYSMATVEARSWEPETMRAPTPIPAWRWR